MNYTDPNMQAWLSSGGVKAPTYNPSANPTGSINWTAGPAKDNGLGSLAQMTAIRGIDAANSGYTRYNLSPHNISGGFVKGDYAPDNSNEILGMLQSTKGVLDRNGNPYDWSGYDPMNTGGDFWVPTNQMSKIPANTWRPEQMNQDTRDTVVSGGSLLHHVGGFLNDTHIGQIAGLAAMAVPGLQPFAAGLNVAGGIANNNLGQIVSGGFGFPGVNSAVNGLVGTGLSHVADFGSALPYVTNGIVGAGKTLLSGGDLTQALTNGAASGLSDYGGATIKGMLGGQDLPNSVIQGLSQAGAGALGTAIKGGDIGQGAFWSGLNGTASGLGKDLTADSDQPTWLKELISSAPTSALNLYRQFQGNRQRTALLDRLRQRGNPQSGMLSSNGQQINPQRQEMISRLQQRMAG